MALSAVGEAGSPRVQVGGRVEDLDTPLILADLDQVERNILDWQSWMDERGVKFRVHVKTHKVPEVALLQTAVDSGMRRGGVDMDDVDGIERLARTIAGLPGVDFDGLTTHRSYFLDGKRSREEEGHAEGELLVDIAERLRARGLEVREVTAGGSFTGKYVAEVPGVTEVRAGTYVFYDVMHLNEGSAGKDQLALTALCRVVSRWGDGGLTIDGGSKTFSGDRGVVGTGNAQEAPPAMTFSTDDRVVIERLTEEHGMGHADGAVALGEKLRFYPFHACTCCNLTNEIVGVRGDRVERVWRVAARGLRT